MKIPKFLTRQGNIKLENERLKIDDEAKKAYIYDIIYAVPFIIIGLGWIIYNNYVGDRSVLSIISVLYGCLSLFLNLYFDNHDKEIAIENISRIRLFKSNSGNYRGLHIKLKNKKTRMLNLEDDSNIAQMILDLRERKIEVSIE